MDAGPQRRLGMGPFSYGFGERQWQRRRLHRAGGGGIDNGMFLPMINEGGGDGGGRGDLGEPPPPPATQKANPNCITNAVQGASGLARPFGNVGRNGEVGHDGVHVVAPAGSKVITLPALTGKVLGIRTGGSPGLPDSTQQVDVLLDGGNVAIYKDLKTVNVRPGQRLKAGTVIGTVGGGENMGLHFTLLKGGRNERNYFRDITSGKTNNKRLPSLFINPLGPNSPVNCPGVPVNNAGVTRYP